MERLKRKFRDEFQVSSYEETSPRLEFNSQIASVATNLELGTWNLELMIELGTS
jgi:hypothetical protein